MTQRLPRIVTALITLAAVACSGDDGPSGPASTMVLNGAPASGQMSIGDYIQLDAAVVDSADRPIGCLYPLKWTNSDTSVTRLREMYPGTVEVHARGLGTSMVTVRCEGVKASTTFHVITRPVHSVDISPDTAAVLVGNTVQLKADVFDSLALPLFDRTVTWASSDNGKARVSATGLVTAIAAGAATITATSEHKSAGAVIRTVARASADWSAVTDEWVAFQGSNSHTGYVPAVVDVGVIALRWQLVVKADYPLNPVTVGGGQVFASTASRWNGLELHAIDASTGVRHWSHDFGGVESLGPPANADGSVYVQTGGQDDSFLWAFDAASGTERFHSPFVNQWSHYYAPVVAGQTVFAPGGYGGGVYAWNTASGAQQWFAELPWYDEYTPAVRDGLVYAHSGTWAPSLTVHDAATGAVVYEIADPNSGGGGYSTGAAPALGGASDLLTTQGNRLLSFNLGNHTIGWQRHDDFHGQVSVADGVLYTQNGDHLEARSEGDGALLWSWRPDGGVDSRGTTIVTRNLLFICSYTTVYAVDLASHFPIWSYPAAGYLALSKDGQLLIAQANGTLTSIGLR